MKRLFYLFLIVGLAVASCKKPDNTPTEQDVVFKAATATTGFKADVCDNDVANYALIDIDGTTYKADVFYLDGVIYTSTLKLTPGDHTVNSFVLKNDNGTPNDDSDDTIVKATPLAGSDYENFVQNPLPYTFGVDAFYKSEVNIEVLCFKPTDITSFGFAWFALNEITVREFAFFGDFCTKYYAEYAGSLYEQQSGGLRHDMPAIFKIDVYRNNNFLISYNNEANLGEGEPLMVQFPDYDNVVDNYDFVLSILVKVGMNFEYKEFYAWHTTDAQTLPNVGSDNVMDFVLGSCVPDADLILAPYMNLPATATMATGSSVPGSLGTYFDVTLSNIGPGYDIQNGTVGVYCADKDTHIYLNHTYQMNIYSSLYPNVLPDAFNAQKDVLDNINWLGNHLADYPGYQWDDLQNAIWMLLNQESDDGSRPIATQMLADAIAYGDNYLPPVGGWAAVMFVDPTADDVNPVLQLLFTLVDP
jgi:hypothetical protein